MTIVDTSTRPPNNGQYILPLIPRSYIRNPVQEAIRLSPMDRRLASLWAYFDAFLNSKDVRYAIGPDLDAIGTRYDVPRLATEANDEVYRLRIMATVQHGTAAASQPRMTAFLKAATNNTPLSAYDDPTTPGYFVVTFYAAPPQGAGVVGLIQSRKAAGTDFTASVQSPGTYGLLETFVLDVGTLDGGNAYITLHAPPMAPVQTGLIDTFVLDSATL